MSVEALLVLSYLSHVGGGLVTKLCLALAIPWTIAPQALLPRIFQARILKWFAISFSRGSSQPRNQTPVSCTAGRLAQLVKNPPVRQETLVQFLGQEDLLEKE